MVTLVNTMFLIISSHKFALVFSIDRHKNHDVFCALQPNVTESKSGCVESMEVMEVKLALFYGLCIFWSWSPGQI